MTSTLTPPAPAVAPPATGRSSAPPLVAAPATSTDAPTDAPSPAAPDPARAVRRDGPGSAGASPVAPSAPVVVFLPALDEEATVGRVVRRVPTVVGGHPVRCVVVDDGSVDATADRARHAGAVVVAHGRNRGLGAAVRTGLAWAAEQGAAVAVFLDADEEYAPEEVDRLVAPILAGDADYVVGSRFAGLPRRMRPHRWLGNRVLTVALRRLAGAAISDGQSGFRALSGAAAADAEIAHDFNYAQVLTLDLLAKGYRYAEVPISYRHRVEGESFVRLGAYLRHVVPAAWRVARRPRPSTA